MKSGSSSKSQEQTSIRGIKNPKNQPNEGTPLRGAPQPQTGATSKGLGPTNGYGPSLNGKGLSGAHSNTQMASLGTCPQAEGLYLQDAMQRYENAKMRTEPNYFDEEESGNEEREDPESGEEEPGNYEEEEEEDHEMVDQEELERYVKNFQEEIEVKFNASEVNGVYKMPRDCEYSESSSENPSFASLREVTTYDLEEQNYRPREFAKPKTHTGERDGQTPRRKQGGRAGMQKNIVDEHGNIHLSSDDLRNDELSVLTALNILENVENVAFDSVSAKLKDKSSPLYHALYRIVEENMKKNYSKKDCSPKSPSGREKTSKSPRAKSHKKQTKSGKGTVSQSTKYAKNDMENAPNIRGATKLEIKKANPKNNRSSVSSQHEKRQTSKTSGAEMRPPNNEEPKASQGGRQSNLRSTQNHSNLNESSAHNSRDGKLTKPGHSSAYHFPKNALPKQSLTQKKNVVKGNGNMSYYKGNLNLDNSTEDKRTTTIGGPLSYGSKPPTPSAKFPIKKFGGPPEGKIAQNRQFNFQDDQFKNGALKSQKGLPQVPVHYQNYLASSQHVNNLLRKVQESSMFAKTGVSGVIKNRREKMISSNANEAPSSSGNFKIPEGLKAYRPNQHQINTTKQNESNSSMPAKNPLEKTTEAKPTNKAGESDKGQSVGVMILGGSSASSLKSNDSSGNSSLDRAANKGAKASKPLAGGPENYSKLSSHLLTKLKKAENFGKKIKQNTKISGKTTAVPSTGNPSFNYTPGVNFQKGLQSHLQVKDSPYQGRPVLKQEEPSRPQLVDAKELRAKNPGKSTETFKFSPDYNKGSRSPTGPAPVRAMFHHLDHH